MRCPYMESNCVCLVSGFFHSAGGFLGLSIRVAVCISTVLLCTAEALHHVEFILPWPLVSFPQFGGCADSVAGSFRGLV